MIRGVAFDLEGTVINNEAAHHLGWIRAAKEIGVTLEDPEDAMAKVPNFIGGPDKAIIEQVFALSDIQQPTTKEQQRFLERKWNHYDELITELPLLPREGFLEVLKRIRWMGLPVAIGTAVELERGIALLRRSELDQLFTLRDIVLTVDVARAKPAPDCFLETARRMGISPNEQLVFEDSPRGVVAGVAAGSPVIAMPTYDNKELHEKLSRAGALEVCLDWRKLALERILTQY